MWRLYCTTYTLLDGTDGTIDVTNMVVLGDGFQPNRQDSVAYAFEFQVGYEVLYVETAFWI